MGRYISMGPAFCYHISKQSLRTSAIWAGIDKNDEKTIKTDLFKHFNKEIYCFDENEEMYVISLRHDITVNDFVELFDEFKTIDYERKKRAGAIQ